MKVKLKIPTDLSDIKLSQYQKFLRTTKDSDDNNFIERQLVGIFCNIPDDIVDKIVRKDFNEIVQTITSILEQKTELKTIIKHNGKKYGFIPKLDDITVGEQADIDSMINDVQKWHKVMGVLYRPVIVEQKNGYMIEDYKPNDLDLTMDVVNGAMVFFYNLMSDLLNYTQSYIKTAVQQPKMQEVLVKNGDGIKTSMELLEETFLNLRMLLSYDYMRR